MRKTYLINLLFLVTFQSFSQIITDSLSKDEDTKILNELLKKSYFDEKTNYYFVFEEPTEDSKIQRIAKKNNIYFAKDDVLNLYIPNAKNALNLILKGFQYNEIAEHVYQVEIAENIITAKKRLEKFKGVEIVEFSYFLYHEACPIFYDPEATMQYGNGDGWGQLYLTDIDWFEAGLTAITHSIDSVEMWRPMHVQTNSASPNIVINIIDGGLSSYHSEFSGNVIYEYNYVTNTNTNTPNDHGMGVTFTAAAKAFNNIGGVGVAHDYPIRSHDCNNGESYLYSDAIISALDNIYQVALANPWQKHVVNMSFSGTNENTIGHIKIQNGFNLQNHSQVFYVAAAGNNGNDVHIYGPARLPEVFGIGGTTISWSGGAHRVLSTISQTGPELDFVADAEYVTVLKADGSYNVGTGTSYASPIIAGSVANLISQDPSADFSTVYQRLKMGAYDMGDAGFDNLHGWGYARTATSLKYAVVEDVPNSINTNNDPNYVYHFTPKFYNSSSLTLNRVCYYPNGQPIPFTVDGNGVITFNVVVNTNNGFSSSNPNVNRLRYEFTTPNYDGCITSIKSLPISISNLSTLNSDEFNITQFINIYPNPTNDILNIEFENDIKIEDIILYNFIGEKVGTYAISKEKSQIDLSQFSVGIYILQITTDKGDYRVKVLKE